MHEKHENQTKSYYFFQTDLTLKFFKAEDGVLS